MNDFLANGFATLPSLKLTISGKAASGARFSIYGAESINDPLYYSLTYTFPVAVAGAPQNVFGFEKI